MSSTPTAGRVRASLPPVDLTPVDLTPVDLTPVAHAHDAEPATAPAPADELSDDDLEQVVGGLARTWTEALHAGRHHA